MSQNDNIVSGNINRRSFMKSLGATVAGTGVLTRISSASGSDYWETTESDDYENDRYYGDLGTVSHVYDAFAKPTYSYWTIPVKVSSDCVSYWDNYNGNKDFYNSIQWSQFSVEWDSSKYPAIKEVDAEKDKTHIGSYQGNNDTNYGYDDFAMDQIDRGVDFLASMVPVAGDLYSAGKVADGMIDDWNRINDDTDKWHVDFDWSNYTGTDEVHYWNKVDVQLEEDDNIVIHITDHVGAKYELANQYSLYISSPSSSPSSVSTMTASEQERNRVKSVNGSEIRGNPTEYGLSPEEAENFRPNETVYTAPVEVQMVPDNEDRF